MTTGAIRHAKSSKSNDTTNQTNTQLFKGMMPFMLPIIVRARKGNLYTV